MKRILMIILMVCMISLPAFGNAASPYESPDGNVVLFDDDTGIVLLEEWVKFTIDENDWSSMVEVVYHIENAYRDDSSLDIMFLAPYFDHETGEVYGDSFKVAVDGTEIRGFEVKEAGDIPDNWKESHDMEIVEPVDDRILERRLEGGRPFNRGGSARGIQFTVDIEKGERKTLVMSYEAEEGYYSFDDVVNDVFTHLYYLTPASFWNGDPVVNLEIEFPDGGYEVYSSIELEKVSDTNYRARLEGLPEEEWTFSYVDTGGLVYGTNARKIHNGITWSIIALTAIACLVVRKRNKLLAILILLGIIGELFLFRPTYGTFFMLYVLGPAIGLPVLLFVIIRAARNYWKKSQEHRL